MVIHMPFELRVYTVEEGSTVADVLLHWGRLGAYVTKEL